MKKQIIIALVFLISVFSFAQKKELRAAEKAIKSNSYSQAKAALKQAEALMASMDEKLKAKYYYLLGQALYANGAGSTKDIDKALESLSKVKGAYSTEITILKQTMANGILTKANKAYEEKDFSTASKHFEHAYRTSTSDTLFLYYAAATATNVQEYERALGLYEELKNLDYTGIEREYFSTNKETGEEEVTDKSTRNLYVKAKSHINPGERLTDSKKPEIVKNIALIYVSQGNNEKALTAMKDARSESPNDINLILSEANVHFKMGNKEMFKTLLEKATTIEPNNAELRYNLGVIASESGEIEQAKAYYNKAIELDSTYINAYVNMAALILGSEESIIEQMNSLGSSKEDDKRYDELREERQTIYKLAIPYLTKALEIDSKSISAAKTLMNIYSIIGETDKYKALKEIVNSLETEN